METQSQCFPFKKSIVFNALYDIIEALGLRLDPSNSTTGTLTVYDTQQTEGLYITIDNTDATGQTRISIFQMDANECFFTAWSAVILDELCGTIRRNYHKKIF